MKNSIPLTVHGSSNKFCQLFLNECLNELTEKRCESLNCDYVENWLSWRLQIQGMEIISVFLVDTLRLLVDWRHLFSVKLPFGPSINHFYLHFFYSFHSQKKQKKIVKKVNGFADPFEENDEDVGRIAKKFEQKYGTAYSGKKRGSNNNECDKGAGYDMNDGFIDNSEAVSFPSLFHSSFHKFFILHSNCSTMNWSQMKLKPIEEDFILIPVRWSSKIYRIMNDPRTQLVCQSQKRLVFDCGMCFFFGNEILPFRISCHSVHCQHHPKVVHLATKNPIRNRIPPQKTGPTKRNQNFRRKINTKTKRRSWK